MGLPGLTVGRAKTLFAPSSGAFTALSARKWGALGDSITHRSSAAAGRGYVDMIPGLAGTAYLSSTTFVEAGVPGQTTDQIRARYITDIRAAGVKTLFLLCGTNDVGTGRSLALWSADVMAIAAMAKQDGIPLIIGTVPPRGSTSATATFRQEIAKFNFWLKTWAPTAGVYIADVWQALATNGGYDMVGGYDSGDGVHPETLGHLQIADAFVTAWKNVPKITLPRLIGTSLDPNQLVTNPTAAGTLGAGRPTGWFEQPGGTGTAPTYSVIAASGGVTVGQQVQAVVDMTASGGTRYLVVPCSSSGWVPGDRIIITAQLGFTDTAGNYFTNARTSNPSAAINLRVVDSGFAQIASPSVVNTKTPGPILSTFTIPAGVGGFSVVLQMTLPTGGNVTVTLGEVGCWNATAIGIPAGVI